MELGALRPYRHSGKFGAAALLLVPLSGLVLGGPLGFAYAYLIKWIPFVYLNVLLTLGYGWVLGAATGYLLKAGRVRNLAVAAILAAGVGVAANYFQWNGHVHALLEDAPLLCPPAAIQAVMAVLFEHGSWALRSGDNVTGWFLAAIWTAEALTIVGVIVYVATSAARNLPYCEKSGCWLDEQTRFETLAPFTEAGQLAALKAGDLAPVIEARPREEGRAVFARLTLKHSPKCTEFFTLRVENVSRTTNTKGEVKEETKALTKDLLLPAEMRPLVERFADLKPAMPADETAAAGGAT